MAKDEVFVEGVPLSEYLSKQEQQERDEAMLEHINGQILYHRHNMPPVCIKRYRDLTITRKGKPRVSKRVKRYSKEEIARIEEERKMAEKQMSKTEQALKVLKEHGSTTSGNLQKMLGWKSERTAGTLLWRMAQCWGEDLKIDKSETPYEYRMSPNLRRRPLEELYEMFLAHQRTLYKSKAKKPRTPPPEPEESKPEPTTFTRTDIPFDVLSDLVREMVRDILVMPEYTDPTSESTAREINLNVNVRFSFSLGK